MGETSVSYPIFLESFASPEVHSPYYFPPLFKEKLKKLSNEYILKQCGVVVVNREAK